VAADANDGRKVAGYLPVLVFEGGADPVVQVIEETTGEVLYTVRTRGNRFQPRVYSLGNHTVKVGRDKPDAQTLTGLDPKPQATAGSRVIKL
jgi:hypothetical protein